MVETTRNDNLKERFAAYMVLLNKLKKGDK